MSSLLSSLEGGHDSSSNYPALAPPAGVVPNFTNPYSLGPILIVVGSILVAIMTIFVLARGYLKLKIQKKTEWDDLTCLLATVGAVAYFISSIFGIHEWNVGVPDLTRNKFLESTYLCDVLSPPVLLCAKLTFLLFYLQVFRPSKSLRRWIYFGITITVSFYTTLGIAMTVFNTPRPGENIFQTESKHYHILIKLSESLAAGGVIIDLFIFLLPIAAVSQLQLAKRQKYWVILLFMTGSIACIASALNLYFRISLGHSLDFTWNAFHVILLALVEICVGVIVSCMPAVSKIIRHHLPGYKILRSRLLSRSRPLCSLFGGRSGSNNSSSRLASDQDGQTIQYGESMCSSIQDDSPSTAKIPAFAQHKPGQMKTTYTCIVEGGIYDVQRGSYQLSTFEEKQDRAGSSSLV